jgi:hypothetical protein
MKWIQIMMANGILYYDFFPTCLMYLTLYYLLQQNRLNLQGKSFNLKKILPGPKGPAKQNTAEQKTPLKAKSL